MGSVEVTSSDPIKLLRSNRSTIFSASCPLGDRVLSTLASSRYQSKQIGKFLAEYLRVNKASCEGP